MATINDIVLIHLEDSPVSFARIESILPDSKRDWFHITLLMLQIPPQTVTWILKNDYINGEPFHMNGKKMRLTKVEAPVEEQPVKSNAQIISFSDLQTAKKNHEPDPG